jgi:hypothetical protein
MIFSKVCFLIPLTVFPSFIWIIAAEFGLPQSIDRAKSASVSNPRCGVDALRQRTLQLLALDFRLTQPTLHFRGGSKFQIAFAAFLPS